MTFSKGFISRKDLGWPLSAAPLKTKKTLGVKVHYEGTKSPVRDHSYCKGYWTGIRNSHLANKAEGYSDVAYNLAVCRHGYVLEGRGIGRRTGANGNQALNANHDSIVVLYGTNDDTVSAEVVQGLKEAIEYLRDHGTGNEIKGHRDGYPTLCPGGSLYALVKAGKLEPGKATSTPPKPAPTYAPFPGASFFKFGKKSPIFKAVGKRLVAEGFKGYKVGPSEEWGPADERGVKWFQQQHKELKGDADGKFGPLTWKMLRVPK